MHKGHYISGAGHLTLIGWVLLGGVFSSEPPPFEMTEVSVISGADFDAMMAAQQPPSTVTDVAQPQTPDVPDTTPDTPAEPDEAPSQPDPQVVETPTPETPPDVTEVAPPQAEVADTPPELDQPVGEVAVLVPDLAPTAVPRPVARVAPQPVAQPDPDTRVDDVPQEAVAPDETGDTPQDTQEAVAAPEATSEIVTEATSAPKASSRPPGRRPAAPQQVTQTQQQNTTESTTDTTSGVNDAVSEALAVQPSGPPLTNGERESLRVAVAACWNVGALSTEALQTVIVVSLRMNQNGTPIVGSMSLDSWTGGSDASAKRVYQQARSAIVRCGSNGFKLPAEKFSQWQNIEMTFDPRKMGRL